MAFPFKAYSVQLKYTQEGTGEPYLDVQGLDCQGAGVPSLRLWRFPEDAVVEGGIYLARGLRITSGRAWDHTLQKWTPRPDLPKTLESNYRTAIEDVSLASSIAAWF